MSINSLKVKDYSLINNLPQPSPCIAKAAAWIRTCEEGSLFAKASAFVLKILTTLILLGSVIGIPLYLMLRDEYHAQKYREIIDKLKCANLHISSQADKKAGEIARRTSLEKLTLKEHLGIKNDAIRSLHQDIHTLQNSVRQITAEKSDAEALNSSLLEHLERSKKEKAELEDDVKDLLEENEKLEEQRQQAKEKTRDRFHKLKERYKEEIFELEEQIKSIKEKLAIQRATNEGEHEFFIRRYCEQDRLVKEKDRQIHKLVKELAKKAAILSKLQKELSSNKS